MKTKNMIWAALSMTAALVMTACTNDDNVVDTPAAPQAEVKTIPYTVTVGQGGDAATTRATVDSDNKTLRFAAGDKLYIKSGDRDDLKGILTLKAGDEGKTSGATFVGTISYTGDAPADGIGLNATLVGTSNVNFDIVDDKVVGGIPSSAYYDNVKEAVEKYSYLTGMSSYGEKEFTLVQIMAFLNFEITFEDGTAAGTTLNTVVSNGGLYPDPYCSADVTTKTEGGKVVAKFVLPVAAGATLSGATVKMGDKAALTINDATLDGKVYNISRSVAATPVVPDGAISGQFSVSATKQVYFSKGNLQAKIASYSSDVATASEWKFADSQYSYIGNAAGNKSFAVGSWVDLFSWVGNSASNDTYGLITFILNSQANHGNVIDESLKTDWGTAAASSIGTGWRTLSREEWLYLFGMEENNIDKSGHARYRKYFRAIVNNVKGIVVLPDDISGISGIPAESSRGTASSFDGKIYTTDAWTALESAGCVFLPAGGGRYNTTVTNFGSIGFYWSSVAANTSTNYARHLYFSTYDVNPANSSDRYYGLSVRLVHDVPAGSQGTQANDRSYGNQSDLGTW